MCIRDSASAPICGCQEAVETPFNPSRPCAHSYLGQAFCKLLASGEATGFMVAAMKVRSGEGGLYTPAQNGALGRSSLKSFEISHAFWQLSRASRSVLMVTQPLCKSQGWPWRWVGKGLKKRGISVASLLLLALQTNLFYNCLYVNSLNDICN